MCANVTNVCTHSMFWEISCWLCHFGQDLGFSCHQCHHINVSSWPLSPLSPPSEEYVGNLVLTKSINDNREGDLSTSVIIANIIFIANIIAIIKFVFRAVATRSIPSHLIIHVTIVRNMWEACSADCVTAVRTGGGGQLRQQSHLMSTNHRLPQMSGDQFLNQFSSALALSRPGVSFLEQSQSKEGGTVYLLRSGVPFSKTIPFNSEESERGGRR